MVCLFWLRAMKRWAAAFNTPNDLELGALEIWTVDNQTQGFHPIHLHGTFFQVLGGELGELGDRKDGWKETLEIPPGGEQRLAVRFDEPGQWLFSLPEPEPR